MLGDVQTAYLFQCGDEEFFAVSPDEAGANLPRSSCTLGWVLREQFKLGLQNPVPAAISPEPILRGITQKGYYIWRDPCWAQRTAHWLRATTPSRPKLPQAHGR